MQQQNSRFVEWHDFQQWICGDYWLKIRTFYFKCGLDRNSSPLFKSRVTQSTQCPRVLYHSVFVMATDAGRVELKNHSNKFNLSCKFVGHVTNWKCSERNGLRGGKCCLILRHCPSYSIICNFIFSSEIAPCDRTLWKFKSNVNFKIYQIDKNRMIFLWHSCPSVNKSE